MKCLPSRIKSLIALLICAVCFGQVVGQNSKKAKSEKQTDKSVTEREVREFLDSYAEDLRQHRREALGNRYDPGGVLIVFNDNKSFETFEQIKNHY